MTFRLEKCPDGSGTLLLDGGLSIDGAAGLKAALQDALAAHERLRLAFGRVEEADVSFLQLLCSAHRTFRKAGRSLVVEGKIPGPLVEIMARAGFYHRCCGMEDTDCLWKGVCA